MNVKKIKRYLRLNLLSPGPSSYKKIIYRAALSQSLRNTGIGDGARGDIWKDFWMCDAVTGQHLAKIHDT
jgi:hypothetical protein